MVFGNCHLVVVDDNDEVVIELPGVIQAFKGNAAAQRTVADECNNIEVFFFEASCFSEAESQADRGRSVACVENIVFWAFIRVGEFSDFRELALV